MIVPALELSTVASMPLRVTLAVTARFSALEQAVPVEWLTSAPPSPEDGAMPVTTLQASALSAVISPPVPQLIHHIALRRRDDLRACAGSVQRHQHRWTRAGQLP